jgi:hypothetical protein
MKYIRVKPGDDNKKEISYFLKSNHGYYLDLRHSVPTCINCGVSIFAFDKKENRIPEKEMTYEEYKENIKNNKIIEKNILNNLLNKK